MNSRISLPEAPRDAWVNGVAVWSAPLAIDTYDPVDPGPYPEFLDNRVYQGSSGRVYPLPFHERISRQKRPKQWQAIHMENAWLRLVILPELGGRLHIAYDKSADYDLFYRNNVIKPALVGLAGPWISGGIEFNWPQHHRPATYLPTDTSIERAPDGTATVWCSDHDPFARMKGMHGIRLTPDSSRIEVEAHLYNRSEVPQTFLWWANVAAAVNDDYQSFFPGDVTSVADHAKRAVVSFPKPDAPYYGIDYSTRATVERPDGDRIDWYRNIPVPTSYMALGSSQDFFGGYDHDRDAGFVHVAAHEFSPGKKQWTWGNAPFGWAWDRQLTDDDGPYVELMAGMYTDNQPDFAILAPGESKRFIETWYPIHRTGPVQFADRHVAVSARAEGDEVSIRVCAADALPDGQVVVKGTDGAALANQHLGLAPGDTWESLMPGGAQVDELTVEVRSGGRVLAHVRLAGPEHPDHVIPARRAVAPPAPEEVTSIDELIHIGWYLDQYRHATRSSVPYFQEALDRDPDETRALTALGAKAYDRADYSSAIALLRRSADLATRWTSTPVSGETHYRLGLALARDDRDPEAATDFALSAWDARYSVSGRFALAQLRCRQGALDVAETLLREALQIDAHHLQSLDLLALVLAAQDRTAESRATITAALEVDGLDAWARDLNGDAATADATVMLDVALEYANAGFADRAAKALEAVVDLAPRQPSGQVNVGPIACLHLATLRLSDGDRGGAAEAVHRANGLDITSAHPSRLDDERALRIVAAQFPTDPLSVSLQGHWLYAHGRHEDAIASWEGGIARGAGAGLAAVLHRNLGIASYNVVQDVERATLHYDRAIALAPQDAKLRFEADLLAARAGAGSETRLASLEAVPQLVAARDDLAVAFAHLLLDVGRTREAREFLSGRAFQPWEGGEGQVLAAWDRANTALARELLAAGRAAGAVSVMDSSINPPHSLGEGRHELANIAEINLTLGDALAAAGDRDGASSRWQAAASSTRDFVNMAEKPFSVSSINAAYALVRLGREQEADALAGDMEAWLATYETADVQVDFFATSLPELLVFHEPPSAARDREAAAIRSQLERWHAARS
ncbi:DUF5107 domain-containing protein [Acidipropionibacterium virtanenii]|uniref:DUF5107 domain-containing protein n=1 Tax=Acidipropionibacterium virtanenii TaxID=2057246 RepID=A0A344UXT6_9ACTN|nr:DUF5107 domain-containing protein [Acidipropionibacterium virtanenii]AXE40084.1 hypothetical protein JS278_02950 [Acidipropionibacterium virtanenii]